MGKDKMTRGELIQFIEGYCSAHAFCVIDGQEKCKLLDAYCGGIMTIDDLSTPRLKDIYNLIKGNRGGLV